MTRSTRRTKAPTLLALALVVLGVLLLLNNFLILGEFEVTRLVPLLLVVLGLAILFGGDVQPISVGRSFSITRGSIEAAALEVQAGELDVFLGALPKNSERLIAGHYAQGAKPALAYEGNEAFLRLLRRDTSWFSQSDWELALASSLPWSLYVSAWVGQFDADLADVPLQTARLATGLADMRVVLPRECLGGEIILRSNLGHIHVISPEGAPVTIQVRLGRFARLHANAERYTEQEGLWVAQAAASDYPPYRVVISSSVGDVYLS